MSPDDIKTALDLKVKGQEECKLQISYLISMHLSWFFTENRLHPSPNAIVTGPTGVGKTHTVRIACESQRIPFAIVDATSLVPAGIVGLQVEDVLADLVRSAKEIIEADGRQQYRDDDIDLARRGIIFVDEFDKLSTSKLSGDARSSAELVQRRLLKLIEGSPMSVGVPRHDVDRSSARAMDTTGILLLAAGAFSGIDGQMIRDKRPGQLKRELANPNEVVSVDVVNFGFIPELVARLPIIVQFGALTESELMEILAQDDISPAGVWVDYFQRRHKTLKFGDDAKRFIVRRAAVLGMGVRGLQQVLFPPLVRLSSKILSSRSTTYTVTAQELGEPVTVLKGGSDFGG